MSPSWAPANLARCRARIKYTGEIALNASLFFHFAFALCGIVLLTSPDVVAQHGKNGDAPNPNFLKGDKIPAGYNHDWNLGPTGARGWIYTKGYETTEARQILVTKIDKASPADGVLKINDVILSTCLLYTSPSPRDKRQSRMPSSA